MLERWTRAVIRGRFVVIACWVAVVVVGALSAGRLPGLLSTSLAVPGTGSEQADTILAQHFGENIEGTFTVVFRVANPSALTARSLDRRLAVAARGVPTARASTLSPGVGILYGEVATSLDLQQAASYTDGLRRALTKSGLPGAYVTGAPAFQHDITPILAADLRRGEVIAVLAALVLLGIVLGLSVALLMPLVVAACTTTAALAIVYLLAHEFLMVLYIPNLVQLIGLGLAIDYSLLVVHRFREELAEAERPVDDAIVSTMATAGRAVLISGIAVAIGLSVLLIIPVPFVRSLGFAGLLVPLVSIVAALTLQPALLSVLGRRGMRSVRLPWLGERRDVEHGLWSRLALIVMRRPVIVLLGSSAVLVAVATPVAWLQLTPGSVTAIPQNIESARGLALLRDRVGPGVVMPIEVVLDAGAPGKALTPAISAATLRLAHGVLTDPEVFVVAIGSQAPYVDSSGQYRRMIVIGRHDFGDEASQQLVRQIRLRYLPAARFPAGIPVYVGGAPAQGADFLARVYGAFPWVVLVVLALAYFVLLRAFRSLLLPLMAVLLDAVSVAATYGLLVVIFRFGVGADMLGLYRVSQIEGWVPVFLFAMLFGLSMDYEVFFVTRMRESWDKGADNMRAVSDGLAHTGRVVSAAAVIMVGALSGLVAGRVAGLQELGAGLALGVLLDATLVRGLLMPSLMALFGRWNWWLPAPIARVARVEASPLAERERRGQSKNAPPAVTSQQ
ncbi:MAG: MMPL family transporter [Acidimicrobiales bacterium]|jgi:RND superfamily putative drug exporter